MEIKRKLGANPIISVLHVCKWIQSGDVTSCLIGTLYFLYSAYWSNDYANYRWNFAWNDDCSLLIELAEVFVLDCLLKLEIKWKRTNTTAGTSNKICSNFIESFISVVKSFQYAKDNYFNRYNDHSSTFFP